MVNYVSPVENGVQLVSHPASFKPERGSKEGRGVCACFHARECLQPRTCVLASVRQVACNLMTPCLHRCRTWQTSCRSLARTAARPLWGGLAQTMAETVNGVTWRYGKYLGIVEPIPRKGRASGLRGKIQLGASSDASGAWGESNVLTCPSGAGKAREGRCNG